jgi:ABC-type antimicrobial peptide transport system permease subunit
VAQTITSPCLVGRSRDPKPEDEAEIVGIVKDIKFTNVTTPAPDVVFVPLFQDQNLGARSGSAKLHVRSRMAPQDVAALVRARIRAQSLPVVVESAQTLEDAIGASMLNDRLRMQASSLFGAIALLLITAGIYGLMAYSVARRTREIGIRMAIGSAPAAIVRLVLIGILIGIPGAVAVMKAVGGMLFGLPPIDPVSLGAAALALSLTGTAASVAPAWRAARLDPVRALRVE